MRTTRPSAPQGTLSIVILLILLSSGCQKRDSAGKPAEGQAFTRQSRDGSSTAPDSINWSQVDQEMGRPGKQEAGGVHRYSMPRSDLTVTSQGVKIKPALSLGPSSPPGAMRQLPWAISSSLSRNTTG